MSVRYSQTQLTPSGDVLICPHSTVEFTCNAMGNAVPYRWDVMGPGIPTGLSYPIVLSTMVGEPLQATGVPGIAVIPHVVSSTGISSSLTVDTANYNLSLGPITVECTQGQEVVGTASIKWLSMMHGYSYLVSNNNPLFIT